MSPWVTVILAAVAMLCADVLATLLVQAEARNRAVMSGVLDTVCWGASIVVTFLSIDALQGHSFGLKVAVVLAVSAANFGGSYLGVRIGKRFVKEDATTIADRVARLEHLSPLIDTRKEST